MKITMESKRCPRCSVRKPISDFWSNAGDSRGTQPYCRPCQKDYLREYRKRPQHRAYMKRWRQTPKGKAAARRWLAGQWNKIKQDPERLKRSREASRKSYQKRRKNPEAMKRMAATRIISLMVKFGWMTRGACIVCGITDGVEAHHPDYASPLLVEWRCRPHHENVHHGGTEPEPNASVSTS